MDRAHSGILVLVAVCTACALGFLPPHISAQSISSRPADLANNEKVIYRLPEMGSITPDNPLFVLKQIRDGVMLALPKDTEDRIQMLIQMNDKYTVYAEKLAHLSKTQRSVQTFESAMRYQSMAIELLKDALKDPTADHKELFVDLRHIATQSNIKQAETIRQLIDDISASEQSSFIELLDKNMQLRKRLQQI